MARASDGGAVGTRSSDLSDPVREASRARRAMAWPWRGRAVALRMLGGAPPRASTSHVETAAATAAGGRQPLSAAVGADACNAHSSCAECVGDPSCGWCSVPVVYGVGSGSPGAQCAGFDGHGSPTSSWSCPAMFKHTDCGDYVCYYGLMPVPPAPAITCEVQPGEVGTYTQSECENVCKPNNWCPTTLPVAHAWPDACASDSGVTLPGVNCTTSSRADGRPPGITKSCADGYAPVYPGQYNPASNYIFQCGEDRKWSQLSPDPNRFPLSCQPVACPVCRTDPKMKGYSCGTCGATQHHYGDPDCELVCANGYRKKSGTSGTARCDMHGDWVTDRDPNPGGTYDLKCEPEPCKSMPPPVNRSTKMDSPGCFGQVASEQGTVCNATCAAGYYKSSGDDARTCEINPTGPGVRWSGDPLICTEDHTCAVELEADMHIYHWDDKCVPGCDKKCTAQCSRDYRTTDSRQQKEYTCDCPEGEDPVWNPQQQPNRSHTPGVEPCLGCSSLNGDRVQCDCDGPPVEHAQSYKGLVGDPPVEAECRGGCEPTDPEADRSYRCERKTPQTPLRE